MWPCPRPTTDRPHVPAAVALAMRLTLGLDSGRGLRVQRASGSLSVEQPSKPASESSVLPPCWARAPRRRRESSGASRHVLLGPGPRTVDECNRGQRPATRPRAQALASAARTLLRDLTSGEALGQDLPSVGPAPLLFSFGPAGTSASYEEDHQGHQTAPEDDHHEATPEPHHRHLLPPEAAASAVR